MTDSLNMYHRKQKLSGFQTWSNHSQMLPVVNFHWASPYLYRHLMTWPYELVPTSIFASTLFEKSGFSPDSDVKNFLQKQENNENL